MKEKIYIVGHKNPDSDSICSAIAYAELKQKLNINAIACRLGPLNEETKYILKKFNVNNPLLIDDARSQLCDIDIDKAHKINSDCTVKEAWKSLLDDNHCLCVMDNDKLVGMITTNDLAKLRLTDFKSIEKMMSDVKLESIASTIKGKILNNVDDFKCSGAVYILTLTESSEYNDKIKGGICVLSDNTSMQESIIKAGAKCLVLSCGREASPKVIELAKANNCAIISTNKDSMAVAQVINESFSIDKIMTTELLVHRDNEYVEDILTKMLNSRFRSYPVLDKNNQLLGTVSRFHLFNFKKKHFILIDHSAKNQSINNIERAYVEEIIDHHHIGNIQTDHPIYYRNQICGCTSTIIAQLYEENGVTPSPEMCGLMLSAIISDTLHFKSATTTDLDVNMAHKLAKLANINLDEYALEMLSASVALIDSTPKQILNRDLKNYEINGYKIAVGQTNYHNIEDLQSILPDFQSALEKQRDDQGNDLLVMMFTHVSAEGSMIVYSGKLSYIMEEIIETSFGDNSGYDRNIISRKQQLMPKLSEIIRNV